MHADAKLNIENDRTIFDEDVAIALLAIDGAGTTGCFSDLAKEGRERCYGPRGATTHRRALRYKAPLQNVGRLCIFAVDRRKADLVARDQLADLPAICGNHNKWTDEAAERGTIRAED